LANPCTRRHLRPAFERRPGGASATHDPGQRITVDPEEQRRHHPHPVLGEVAGASGTIAAMPLLTTAAAHSEAELRRVLAIDRPHPELMTYYVLTSFLAGPFFFIPLVYLFFRYHTMRYRFDEDGVSMRWGILFRREVSLAYARIQDIHLTSNLVERWLGLAQVKLSTASGSSSAEMTVEGRRDYELVRDFLYARMRGVPGGASTPPAALGRRDPAPDPVVAALRQVSEDLRAIRSLLEKRERPPHD
jgi:membrane protein YdbS with pleckstrin-like domain